MRKDMTIGNPMKIILLFSLPVLLGNLFQQFYNMVDTVIVGQYLGEDALAAVGSTGCLMFLVLGFFPVNGEIRLAMALVTGMPTMTAVVMMANASGLDGDYALGGVFITTLCGIVTLPCICWLLQYVI